MGNLSQIFDQPGAMFCLVREGQKFPPIEKGWQNNPRTFAEAVAHIEKGGNVGVIAGNGFIGLDKDLPSAFEGLELPDTTLWETRPGRYGLWFRVSDDVGDVAVSVGKKPDLGQFLLYKNGEKIGEIKLQRTYQTVPPSWKTLDDGTRADYKFFNEIPPNEISLSKLVADLQRLGITFSEKPPAKTRLDQNITKLEAIKAQTTAKRFKPDGHRLLRGECQKVGEAQPGDRNTRLNGSAYFLGKCVASGLIDEATVRQDLTVAATYAGLNPAEIQKTLDSGLSAGITDGPLDYGKHQGQLQDPTAKPNRQRETQKERSIGPSSPGTSTDGSTTKLPNNGTDAQAIAHDSKPLVVDLMTGEAIDPKQNLEDALLFIAGRCDSAKTKDGTGFNKHDSVFGHAVADRVKAGKKLVLDDYQTVWRMLKNYNKQLTEGGFDIRLIPKEPPLITDDSGEPDNPTITEEARTAALEVLKNGDVIRAHLDYVNQHVFGVESEARAVLYSAYSAYMRKSDRLHVDAVGSAQGGKSEIITKVLETFPQENVLVTSEASPKSLYYLANENPERLENCIIYVDDARPEHIPLLKTFRNEGSVTPRNITVVDGKALELIVSSRPTVLASSVTPLRDHEQQATSRTFLVSIPDATPENERKVRAKIRDRARFGAIMASDDDERLEVLRAVGTVLRDEGIKDVLIPFDATEPKGADRRGTGQFMRLIKVSAYVNQFKRPILEFNDGRRFVLAIYEDLENAARVWFDFAETQGLKLSAKSVEVLREVPGNWPGKSAPMLAEVLKMGQRSTERYLLDLYEAGAICREKMQAPGLPWGYWTDPELRQNLLSQISDTGDVAVNSDRIATKNLCRKYLGENSSDSLKDSYYRFFTNNDIITNKMLKGIKYQGNGLEGLGEKPEKMYDTLFLKNSVANTKRDRPITNNCDKAFCRDSTTKPPDSDNCDNEILSQFPKSCRDSKNGDEPGINPDVSEGKDTEIEKFRSNVNKRLEDNRKRETEWQESEKLRLCDVAKSNKPGGDDKTDNGGALSPRLPCLPGFRENVNFGGFYEES